jgi:hypothetical protein
MMTMGEIYGGGKEQASTGMDKERTDNLISSNPDEGASCDVSNARDDLAN